VRQAEYWREMLIPLGLDYRRGERVLEIGCAAGAALGVLATTFPGIQVSGIDLEPRQIEFARRHLASLPMASPDLRVGNATALPWPDRRFDHVFLMWFIEHVPDPMPFLREAHRVLRLGGSIAITETDYTTFQVTPLSADWDYLAAAQHDYYARHGNPIAGRMLGNLLAAAGFTAVKSGPVGFHFFAGEGDGAPDLARHVEYVADFIAPGIERMAGLGFDAARLARGIEHLRRVPAAPDGSITTVVYRAHARRGAA